MTQKRNTTPGRGETLKAKRITKKPKELPKQNKELKVKYDYIKTAKKLVELHDDEISELKSKVNHLEGLLKQALNRLGL